MILETFTLPEIGMEGRLYPAIRRMLPQVPERFIREAFERRDVKMNGVRVKRDTEAIPGAEIKIYFSDDCPAHSPEILYEDDNLIIVNKPVGVSCEADDKGGLTIGEWLFQCYPDRLDIVPMPCHRLDNPTDGLLILARNEHTLALMKQAFYDRTVHKKYICLVYSEPVPPEAVLEAYLLKDAANAQVRVYDRPVAGALPIRTGYRVLAGGEVSRLEITLYTGRTHQIRAHMAHIGHPLLGDDKYGDRNFNREHHANRLMLTATELTFEVEGELSYLNGKRFALTPKF